LIHSRGYGFYAGSAVLKKFRKNIKKYLEETKLDLPLQPLLQGATFKGKMMQVELLGNGK